MLAFASAVAAAPSAANLDGAETLGVDSPIGRIDYYPGRGLRLGDTRITLGGFTKAEAELLEGGDNRGGFEGANFFLFFDPLPFVHVFSELGPARWSVRRRGKRESGRVSRSASSVPSATSAPATRRPSASGSS